MTRPGRAAAATLGIAAVAGAASFAYGVAVERRRWTVREEVLPILDPGSRPITVLHLSDMHMAPWQADKQEFIRSLAVYEPDLIVDTGDDIGHRDGLDGLRYALEPFAGIAGAFVHGSNDYYAPTPRNPLAYFLPDGPRRTTATSLDVGAHERYFTEELGWLDLDNRARAIELRGSRLELFGTNDAHRGWDRLDLVPTRIEEMREQVEWSEDASGRVVGIGVTHAPYRRVLDAFTTQGADLLLAGHTHGGQVRIPGRPALVTNCDIPARQAQGVSVWTHGRSSAVLEVSAGIGTSIYAPIRFACPPEAVVLTLVPSAVA